MKTNKNNTYVVLLMFFIALLLFDCASTPKQPLWDFEGIQRVAIIPFGVMGQSDLERETAKYLYSNAQVLFQRTGRIIIVDTEDQADAIFRDELIDSVSERHGSDSYHKIIISYSLMRTSDGSIIGENTVYFTNGPSSSITLEKFLLQELGVRYY